MGKLLVYGSFSFSVKMIGMLSTLKTIILFVILLSTIVSIHELGHLIAAKIFGVYCKEYAIGMGPKIYSHQFKETEFSIRALPLGGFVAMAGDNENSLETKVDTTNIPIERTLPGISKWKRIIIMLAGIFMNFVLAIVIYSLIILGNGQYSKDSKPAIEAIVADSPASNSSLQAGDIITKIEFDNGASLSPKSYTEITVFTSTYYDGVGPWHISVTRNNKKEIIDVIPNYNDLEQRYIIGIQFKNEPTDVVDINILNCFVYGFDYAFLMLRIIFTSLVSLFKGIGLDQLSGPVGIYQTVETVADYGAVYYLQLIAMISINVGAFNALPLPIFDGGRVLLTLIEVVIGKPLSKDAEELVMKISMAVLLTLFIYVSFNDVIKLIRG